MQKQHTIAASVQIAGRGLFHGKPVTLTFRPAPANHGIVFVRTDLPKPNRIPATIEHIEPAERHSVLRAGEAVVETCEHCLAALAGLQIDNVLIELNGPEPPLGDGSALLFFEPLEKAGLEKQDAARLTLQVREPISIENETGSITILPGGDDFRVLYDLDYAGYGWLERQLTEFSLSNGSFGKDLAGARTFSMDFEAQALQERGLFEHVKPADVLVIGESGPIDNSYRYADEPARHKILDLLGDFYLLGVPIQGQVIARGSGHATNHEAVRRLRPQLEAAQREHALQHAPAMDILEIRKILPHRYPMLLVDRVVEMETDQRAVGIKNVTANEPYFIGHYPKKPIMPGVLIVESMCQLAGLLMSRRLEHIGKIAMLLSLDRVKLRRPVTPGDQLILEAVTISAGRRTGNLKCRAFVLSDLVAEAHIKFILVDPEE
jgi:UDP-3-O-[3-hydroxymyristoyl] N-acetylglucosamine deacetylase / 3-hydroxyacyl-[acyl-carrier-protein] dehydratase